VSSDGAAQSDEQRTGWWKIVARAFLPLWILVAIGFFILPFSGNHTFYDLNWYQQAVSFAYLPALIWTAYRLYKKGKDAKPTPEQRVGVEMED